MRELMKDDNYQSTPFRWTRQGMIQNAWEESKSLALEQFKDPELVL